MKVLILADVNSIHTRKWVMAMATNNITIGLFSLTVSEKNYFKDFDNVHVFLFENQAQIACPEQVYKKHFFSTIKTLRRIVNYFEPDIIHAHYSSSYGLFGALLNRKPYVISVWGSDIFDFPKRSFLHKLLIRFNLSRAQAITSTSHIMANEVRLYSSKRVDVIPFGVESDFFKVENAPWSNTITIGTIKSLEKKYGIDILINAFAGLTKKVNSVKLKLKIIGIGSQLKELKKLTERLNIANDVEFMGVLAHDTIVNELKNIDVFTALSVDNSESFGVSVVEAMAAGKPILVSNAGGLKEVIVHNETGLVVEINNVTSATNALLKLIEDEAYAKKLGNASRRRALKKYQWTYNQEQMLALYSSLVSGFQFDLEQHYDSELSLM